MNKFTIPLASLAIVLAFAAPCSAHSLHPVFWGLGPVAPMISASTPPGWLLLTAIVSVQALILCRVISGATFWDSLWRAAVILVVSRVAEIGPAFIHPNVFFGASSEAVRSTIAAVIFAAGTGVSLLLIRGLYWRSHERALRLLWLSVTLEIVSCLGLYAGNMTLLTLRFVR
jgi:hypothetical protein